MRKLNKVIFIAILLITVVLPLSARKAVTVTWQWVLSDSAVKAYRYQMNGEKDEGWTVVDGTISSFTAIGLDPYLDYTLYLQASYDGVNWSESSLSVAYALLSLDDVPLVDDSVVLPYEGELPAEEVKLPVEETSLVVEEVTSAVEEAVESVEKEVEPSILKTVFYVHGYGVENEWSDDYFKAEVTENGIVTSSDVLGFIGYESEKYPDVFSSIDYTLIDNGFVLTFKKGLYDGRVIAGQLESDLIEYIDSLFVLAEEAPVIETAKITLYGYTLHNTLEGTVFTSTLDEDYRDIVYSEDIQAFIDYEMEKYPLLMDAITVETIDNGTLVLAVPSVLDFNLFIDEYESEIVEFVTLYSAYLENSGEIVAVEKAETAAEAPEEEVPAVVEESRVEVPAEEEVVETAAVSVEEEDALVPDAPSSVGARLLEGDSSSALKTTFNLGFNIGAEWGFVDSSVTCFPRLAITLEGQNLIKAGKFGFGIRSDISSLFIPYKWIENGYNFDLTNLFSSSDFGFDITADLKAMTYYNLDRTTFYFGLGAGYTIASQDYTTTHTLQKLFSDKFNSAVVLTGVVGIDLRLGGCAYLTLEGYSRAFIFNEVKSGTVGTAVKMNFKF